MNISEIGSEITEEFSIFEDWMQKYEHLIEMGKALQPMDDRYKIIDNLIKGCQSQVWLTAEMKDDKVYFKADSDAIITKGMVALLIRALSGQKPADILEADLKFIEEIGLNEHLSQTRANGLVSMIKQMKLYALAFNNNKTE